MLNKKQVDFLDKWTKNIKHSKLTLYDHLVGTGKLIEEAAPNNKRLILAAYFHSVYGTASFKNGPLAMGEMNRKVMKRLVGVNAEAIIFAFCDAKLPRIAYFKNNYKGKMLENLLLLNNLNGIEQQERTKKRNKKNCDPKPDNEKLPIHIFDGLFTLAPVARLLCRPLWKFGWKSNKTQPEYKFWNITFLKADKKGQIPTKRQVQDYKKKWKTIDTLTTELFSSVELRDIVKDYTISRIYANGYTYGCGGAKHTDDGDMTVLCYTTEKWNDKWNGETEFFDNDEEIIAAVRYVPGRTCVFDSKQVHQGREVAKTCNALRTIITFKLLRKK